jgi:16S rRNA (guanine(966)-N(2))-methyltransferase RsmD
MRIIAGKYKGRRLIAPPGRDVRPTSDYLREALFNVIGTDVAEARVLDGFAGTGALGLEALSRGAARAVFVERDRAAIKAIEANIATCGAESSALIVDSEFLRAPLDVAAFTLILLDPPYDTKALGAILTRAAALAAPGSLVVLEHSSRQQSPEAVGTLMRYRLLSAGDSALSLYRS